MSLNEQDPFRKYVVGRLRSPHTWATSALVGTFINLYGLVLVPLLRGADPVSAFVAQLQSAPAVSALTIALGYAFPLFVSAYSSAAAQFASRHAESLAQFPDRKPDPVFRVDSTGLVVDAGQQTSALFEEHGVQMATDILGPGVWDTIAACAQAELPTPEGLLVHFEKADRWYLVAHSPAAAGHVNLYLTSIAPEMASRLPESPNA